MSEPLFAVTYTGLFGRGNFAQLCDRVFPGRNEQRVWRPKQPYNNGHLRGRRLAIFSHSFGTEPADELCEELCPQKIDLRVYYDPVRLDDSNYEKHDPIAVPMNVLRPACFSRDDIHRDEFPPCTRLTDEIFNHFTNIGHGDFPFDEDLMRWVEAVVQALENQ